MSNLTKNELLKHRHLSLLKALDAKGINAFTDCGGNWTIQQYRPFGDTRIRPEDVSRVFRAENLSVGFYRQCGTCYNTGYLYQVDGTRGQAKVIPCPAKGCQVAKPYTLTIMVDGGEVRTKLSGGDFAEIEITRKYDVKLHELLNALHAAIVSPSPAKVD